MMRVRGATVFCLTLLLGMRTPICAEAEVYMLYTNNTNGTLENCLCPGKSYGSMEKRVVYVGEWLAEHPNTLLVDAGDFLSATRNTLKDSIAFRAYELVRYDVIGLGDQEFFRGVSFLSELVENSQLPFVSTNLKRPELTNVEEEIIVERAGVTFGILSVMDPEIFRFYPRDVSEAVEVEAYEKVLPGRIGALRKKVDVVILLSHLGIDKDRQVARAMPGIDIIVGSHTQTVLEEPEKVENTIIVQAGKDGYYVGELRLFFDESKSIQRYEGKLVPMDISLPNDSTVVAMIVDYNRLKRREVGKRVERIVPVPEPFVVTAVAECGGCHSNQIDHWVRTRHAASFETLKQEHKQKSPDCLACHTTGFGRDDGYLNYNITAGLKNINCTECHYVAAGHLREPALNPAEPVLEERCVRCHDRANSPEFEFSVFVERIRHPVEVAEERVLLEPEPPGGARVAGEVELPLEEDVQEVPAVLEPEFVYHRVQKGETLWSLAVRYLGRGSRWVEIYELNREVVDDPDLILVAQSLKIPVNNRGE